MKELFISNPFCWAPGISTAEEWAEWKNGTRHIQCTEESPSIDFTAPVFRRRLSQLTKMTIQVVHDAVQVYDCTNIKQVFVSQRGEIKREYTINEKLITEQEVSPSAFSLSVFNAPIALASIACHLKSGYSVMFPSGNNFSDALDAACAPLLCKDETDILFIYADELVPECYGALRPTENEPLAFAAVISSQKRNDSFKVLSLHELHQAQQIAKHISPSDFLRGIL
ncbi:MAG: beta-ketoacyl synthase chain length factor [Treponema sp.]|nr:beta-ketoacyl synthase chain length factor [Treponema sp.]